MPNALECRSCQLAAENIHDLFGDDRFEDVVADKFNPAVAVFKIDFHRTIVFAGHHLGNLGHSFSQRHLA